MNVWRSGSSGRQTVGALVALASAGCSLLSNFDVQQCDSDADCRTLTGETLRCEQARCVAGCQNNHQCAALDPRYPFCPLPGGQCASLTSNADECYLSSVYDDRSMGALTGADMTVIGAFAPSLRSSTWLSIELAAAELNSLPSSPASRPVLVVLCSDALAAVPGAMDHLVGKLGVRALLGSFEEESLAVALSLPKTAGKAFFLSPHSVPIGAEQRRAGGPLLWYLGGEQTDVVAAYPALVRRGLAALGSAGSGAPRIASLVGPSAEDAALADAVEAVLDFGGQDVRDLERLGRYQRRVLDDDSPSKRAALLQELAGYAPQFVWTFLGGSFAEPVALERSSGIVTLDGLLSGSPGGAPLYLLGPRSFDDAALRAFAAVTPSFRARAVGIEASRARDSAILEALVSRFAQAFPAASAGELGITVSASEYDAFYYLAYASRYASAAHPVPRVALAAEDLTDGLRAVSDPDGRSITVGPGSAGLEAAGATLAQGATMDLLGTSGPADFDPLLQARPSTARLYCWREGGTAEGVGQFDAALADFDVSAADCAQRLLDAP